MSIHSILQKVKALRNLSARAGTPEEAATAAAQADALLQKYRLSEADVGTASADTDGIIEGAEPLWSGAARLDKATAYLCAVLAEHYGCTTFSRRGSVGGRTVSVQMRIAGRASDVEIVRYMFAWLSIEVARLAKGEPASTRHSFRRGAINGIHMALRASVVVAAKEHASAHGGGAAMVLASRADEAKAWTEAEAKKNGGRMGKAPAPSRIADASAYLRGRSAGASISLGARGICEGDDGHAAITA